MDCIDWHSRRNVCEGEGSLCRHRLAIHDNTHRRYAANAVATTRTCGGACSRALVAARCEPIARDWRGWGMTNEGPAAAAAWQYTLFRAAGAAAAGRGPVGMHARPTLQHNCVQPPTPARTTCSRHVRPGQPAKVSGGQQAHRHDSAKRTRASRTIRPWRKEYPSQRLARHMMPRGAELKRGELVSTREFTRRRQRRSDDPLPGALGVGVEHAPVASVHTSLIWWNNGIAARILSVPSWLGAFSAAAATGSGWPSAARTFLWQSAERQAAAPTRAGGQAACARLEYGEPRATSAASGANNGAHCADPDRNSQRVAARRAAREPQRVAPLSTCALEAESRPPGSAPVAADAPSRRL